MLAERKDMIQKSVGTFNNDTVMVEYLKEGTHQLHLFDLPKKSSEQTELKFNVEIKMPEPGAISDLSAKYNETKLNFRF